jgi:hypothetical protein
LSLSFIVVYCCFEMNEIDLIKKNINNLYNNKELLLSQSEKLQKEIKKIDKEITEKIENIPNMQLNLPVIKSAIYGVNYDVSDIVRKIAQSNNYLIKFDRKEDFNKLFTDPNPGMSKSLVIQYINIFGEYKTSTYRETDYVIVDLLR